METPPRIFEQVVEQGANSAKLEKPEPSAFSSTGPDEQGSMSQGRSRKPDTPIGSIEHSGTEEATGLTFITVTKPKQFRHKSNMTSVRKKAMDHHLQSEGKVNKSLKSSKPSKDSWPRWHLHSGPSGNSSSSKRDAGLTRSELNRTVHDGRARTQPSAIRPVPEIDDIRNSKWPRQDLYWLGSQAEATQYFQTIKSEGSSDISARSPIRNDYFQSMNHAEQQTSQTSVQGATVGWSFDDFVKLNSEHYNSEIVADKLEEEAVKRAILVQDQDWGATNIEADLSREQDTRDSEPKPQAVFVSDEQFSICFPEAHLLKNWTTHPEKYWTQLQSMLPQMWKWDVEYHAGCWTCTPMDLAKPEHYPLTIAGISVVLPVEHQWPPIGGVNPPPDPRFAAPIDPRSELPFDIIQDLFSTFPGSCGFYVLINGFLQVLIPDDFDTVWASSHLPHAYGGLKVSYIAQTLEATMLQSKTETAGSSADVQSRSSGFSAKFGSSHVIDKISSTALGLNDFIEARPRSGVRKAKYAGRIGLKVYKDEHPYLLMSSHVVTEAMFAKSHLDVFFGRNRYLSVKSKPDWNDHVEIWARNEKIGAIEKTFDPEADIYPSGFQHDITLIKPESSVFVKDVASPISNLGWLTRQSWSLLRQQTSTVRILGSTESHRSGKSLKCSRPSEILVVGEGIFLNQTSAAGKSKSLKDHDISTWKDLVSRALLYRVHPDFDPPNGQSGIALYAEGIRQDGSEGPGIIGFQSFVQRSGHVQNFNMEGSALEQRLRLGRVAFYGAFEVPEELKREYTIA